MQEKIKPTPDMWDLKEKSYPKFSFEDCQFQKDVIKTTQIWGLAYEDKEILEVGCGTGGYTFLLAQMAKFVDALDFSEQMLEALKRDSLKFNLTEKIRTIHSDFAKFESEKVYDIAFAAMTPALFDEKAYAKFDKFAKIKIWLGWAGKRSSALLYEVFEAHFAKLRIYNTSVELKTWLENRKIPYKYALLETTWQSKLGVDDMVEDQAWHLKMSNIEPNLEKIYEVVAKFKDKDDMVTNKTDVKLELVSW